jgi:hypothetical protein
MPIFLLVDTTFLGFAWNSFETRLAAAFHFSKGSHANLENVLFNRKKGIKSRKDNSAYLSCCQKSMANSKAFDVKRFKTD